MADAVDKGWRAYQAARRGQAPSQQQQERSPLMAGLSAAALRACCTHNPQGVMQACADSAAFLLVASASAATALPAAVNVAAGSAREQRSPLLPLAASVADTAMWHAVASLAIPGVIINRTVWASGRLLAARPGLLSPALARAVPTVAGLSLIPLLVPHIDEAVSVFMDGHVRPWLGTTRPEGGAAAAAAGPAHAATA